MKVIKRLRNLHNNVYCNSISICISITMYVKSILISHSGNENINDTIQARLVNGQGAHEGRVEILYAGVWGAICNDLFNLTAANVVCRQLGYPGAVRVASYESDSRQIWLDDVQCTGKETSIDQCSHNGFNIYDCNFATDQVGVECIGKL